LEDGIRNCFDQFGGVDSIIKGKVFLKFNGTMQFQTAMTSTEVILSTIRVIKETTKEIEYIYVMDNSGVGSFTRLVFQVNDLGKQVKELGAKPLYLDEEKSIDINFDGTILNKPIPVPKILYENLVKNKERNTYINLPRLKSHVLSKSTASIKNQHGLLYDREKIFKHNLIHEKIVDILNVFKPDFNIIDATSVVNYGPMAIFDEWSVPMNLLISGIDPVAVDTVSSRLIGIKEVEHIDLAAKRGFGTNNFEEIEIVPSKELLKTHQIQLNHENIPKKVPDKVTIFRGKERVCKAGCAFLKVLFIWFGTQRELKECVGIYGKGHNPRELDKFDGPFIVNGECAVSELKEYFEKRKKKEDIKVYYIDAHLNIAEAGIAIRKALGISIADLKALLPCSLLKMVGLMILAKLKGGNFISIR
jgi:uncharacterized protein (DUF362 family)